MLDEYFPGHAWQPAAIRRHYDAEREQQRRQNMLDRISSMSRRELRRAIRSAEYRIGRSHEKQDQAWKFWIVYRNRCEAELEHQIAAGKRAKWSQEPPPACLLAELAADGEPVPGVEASAPSGCVCSTPAEPRVADLLTAPRLTLTTVPMLVPRVNADQVRFLVEQLPKGGPGWAREHMARVQGFEAWPWDVRQAVRDAEVAVFQCK